jgi:hypothetical protein
MFFDAPLRVLGIAQENKVMGVVIQVQNIESACGATFIDA